MLATALFCVCIIGLCAGVVLEGGLAFARVSARHAAAHYAQVGLAQSREYLLAAIAEQIAAGSKSLVAPGPLAPAPACSDAAPQCPFTFGATFALSGTLGDSGAPNVEATDIQLHPAIAEGRVAATIVNTVATVAGTPLAVRTEYVTLRTFAVPPYAAIDGITDAAAARDVPVEADAAGCNPSLPVSCDANNLSAGAMPAPAGSMNPADTRIHALRECVDGGSGACGGQVYVNADPQHTPAQSPWFNGNAQTNGWSR